MKEKTHEPLFHIVRRNDTPAWKAWMIRGIALLLAFFVCGLIFTLLTKSNPLNFAKSMFNGNFGTSRRAWQMGNTLAILLCISLAVTPAFKMRFWNIGAEGQVLMSGLACTAVMFYLGKTDISRPLLWLVMAGAAVITGMIWTVIPALFKAKWGTNETLFTLMMNYIAVQLVKYAISIWAPNGSGKLSPMTESALPVIPLTGNKGTDKFVLNILVVAVLTAIVYIYLRFSKHGYEIAVVGQSENTARYIGINVRKVIIRTLLLSGALCGVAGLLIVGGQDYMISEESVGGQGFTAIMVSWLAKFNPLFMVLTSFLIAFLTRGAKQVSTDFSTLDTSVMEIIPAIVLLFIIGCEFFINYRIMFRHAEKEDK